MTYRIASLKLIASIPTLICLSFSCLILVTSCETDASQTIDVNGYWEIVEAVRNGKPTLTLENAYIHFRPDSILETNLLRTVVESPYVQNGNSIIQESPRLIQYNIVSQSNDSLSLETEIQGYQFRFVMVYVDSLSTGN